MTNLHAVYSRPRTLHAGFLNPGQCAKAGFPLHLLLTEPWEVKEGTLGGGQGKVLGVLIVSVSKNVLVYCYKIGSVYKYSSQRDFAQESRNLRYVVTQTAAASVSDNIKRPVFGLQNAWVSKIDECSCLRQSPVLSVVLLRWIFGNCRCLRVRNHICNRL